ncbi:hypothetical protein GCM10020229_50240 [Kitasatospora albolonga]|uniref:hypothetical protein n=1 Tax=Kitasatospora albolonga TaxID=68173 RepID=UPI0031E9657B
MRVVEDVGPGSAGVLDFAEVYALESYTEMAGLIADRLGAEAAGMTASSRSP